MVSAWSREDSHRLGQKGVEEKSNEIIAILEVLDVIAIKGQAATTDAMGTQRAIAEKIKERRADYVLELKGKQGILREDVKLFLKNNKEELKRSGNYYRTIFYFNGDRSNRFEFDYFEVTPEPASYVIIKY